MRTSTVLVALAAAAVPVLSTPLTWPPPGYQGILPVVDTNLKPSLQQRELLAGGSFGDTESGLYRLPHAIPERRSLSIAEQMARLAPGDLRRKGLQILENAARSFDEDVVTRDILSDIRDRLRQHPYVPTERRDNSLQYQIEKLPPGPRRKGLEILQNANLRREDFVARSLKGQAENVINNAINGLRG